MRLFLEKHNYPKNNPQVLIKSESSRFGTSGNTWQLLSEVKETKTEHRTESPSDVSYVIMSILSLKPSSPWPFTRRPTRQC